LAQEVVLHALQPLVYSPGPLDTENSDGWVLKSSSEILDLRVADIAAGSGAFLVAAAEYLADRFLEARAIERAPVIDDDPKRFAKREVIARCLYGADINGMAVEMCKLSLWLISMDQDKPFSFIDDRVFHGNSLLGVTTEAQLKAQHIYPKASMKRQLAAFDVDKDLETAASLRRQLASGQVDDADPMRSTRAKRALLEQSKDVTVKLRDIADGIIAAGLLEGGKPGRKLEERYDELAEALRAAYPADGSTGDRRRLDAIIDAGLTPTVDTGEVRWKPLHWILEAPDVIHDHGGFDAIIGNPPFLGGKKISGSSGSNFREYVVATLADHRKGEADLVGYFLLRVAALLRSGATTGLIVSESLAEGDGRRVTLDPLLQLTWTVFRSVKRRKWPTEASVHVSLIWLTDHSPASRPICDGEHVAEISSALEPAAAAVLPPIRLISNAGRSYMGAILSGKGFILEPEEWEELVDRDAASAAVCRPFITGEDVNGTPTPGPTKYVIDFGDLPLSAASAYPEALDRVRQLVKPARDKVRKKQYRERWWQFAERAPGLSRGLSEIDAAIAIVLTSDTLMPVRLPSSAVFSNSLGVFLFDDFGTLCLLSSSIHQLWAMRWGSSLDAASRYTPSDVFETLPLPTTTGRMGDLGRELDDRRRGIMLERRLNLTALYKFVNSKNIEHDADVDLIRSIHVQIDEAVMEAYGWTDIPLDHGFHTYRQMERWTVSPAARVEILDRLLEENHRRAAIEAQQNPKKAKRGKSIEESEKPEGAMF
jgi:hypothetical protein